MKIAKMKTKDFLILGFIFLILNLLDVHSTYLAITEYGIEMEANILMKYLLQESFPLVIVLKVLSVFMITYWCLFLNNVVRKKKGIIPTKKYVGKRKGSSICMIVVNVGLFLIVSNNYLGYFFGIAFINFKGMIVMMFLTAGILGYFT